MSNQISNTYGNNIDESQAKAEEIEQRSQAIEQYKLDNQAQATESDESTTEVPTSAEKRSADRNKVSTTDANFSLNRIATNEAKLTQLGGENSYLNNLEISEFEKTEFELQQENALQNPSLDALDTVQLASRIELETPDHVNRKTPSVKDFRSEVDLEFGDADKLREGGTWRTRTT